MKTERDPTETGEATFFQHYMGNGKLTDEEFVEQLFLWLADGTPTERAQLTFRPLVLGRLRTIEPQRPALFYEALARFRAVGIAPYDVVQGMRALPKADHAPRLQRQSAQALMQATFAPLQWLATGLLHEGNIIFAGKSKRGKSWVALNIAVSLATGQQVFGHYDVPTPIKVAYCALEDGPRRVQRRLSQMEIGGHDLSNLEIILKLDPFADGGVEQLKELIGEGYQLIIIDVLAKVEGQGKHGSKDYLEAYATFAPLIELRNQYRFALLMITHLRKAEAQDMTDGVMGSTAYVGAQDVVWTFNRRHGEHAGFLDIADKDMAEKTVELTFQEQTGRWTFVGEGDEHAASKEEHEVLTFLHEERKPQSVAQIMEGCGIPKVKFHTFRKRLQRMVANSVLVRTDRGMYAALGQGSWERLDNEVPF